MHSQDLLFHKNPITPLVKEGSIGKDIAKALSVPGAAEGLRASRAPLLGESAAGRTVLDAVYDTLVRPISERLQKSESPFLRTFAPLGPDPYGTPLVRKNLDKWAPQIDKAYDNLTKSQVRALTQNTLAGTAIGAGAGALTDDDMAEGAGKGALVGAAAGGLTGLIRGTKDYAKAISLARKAGADDLSYASLSELASRGIGGRKLEALERWLNEHATKRLHSPAWEVAAPGAAAAAGAVAIPNIVNAVTEGKGKKSEASPPSFSRYAEDRA